MGKFGPRQLLRQNARLSYHDMILETAGLVSYWNFGAGSGNKAWDQKGVNHGTISGATWTQKSNGIYTLDFDGTNDLVGANGVSVTDYSAECWFKPDDVSGTKTIVEQGNFIIRQIDADIEYGFTTDTGEEVTDTATTVLTATAWHFLVITKEGNDVILYVDGILVDSFTDATTQNSDRNLSMAVSDRNYFPYIALTPSNLTGEKGVLITREDDLQYSRGSKTQNNESVVYENFDPHQGTLEFWVRPNWDGDDGVNHWIYSFNDYGDIPSIALLHNIYDDLIFYIADDSGPLTLATYDASGWTAGTWYHIVAVWDSNNTVNGSNYIHLYESGTSRDGTTDQPSITDLKTYTTFHIGEKGDGDDLQFNGTIAGRILNRPLTSTEVTALYNSGSGSTDTFTVTPDTVWLGTYSDDDTDAVFQHRGQAVSGATATVVTLGEAVGSRSWADNDRVVVYDGTGYKIESAINDAGIETTDTTITVDSVAALANVGRSLDFDATYYAQAANNTIHDITTEDLGIAAWIKSDVGYSADYQQVLWKEQTSTILYRFYVHRTSGILTGQIGDGVTIYTLTGDTDVRDGKWHHVAVIFDRNNTANSKIYLDGYEDGTTNKSGTTPAGSLTNTAILSLGTKGGGERFSGQIRDVIIAYPADIMAANEMGASGEILTLATGTRDLSTVNSEDTWALNDNAATTVVVGAVNNLTASANTDTFDSQSAFISKNLIADSGMENGGIGGWSLNYDNSPDSVLSKEASAKFDTQTLKVYIPSHSGTSGYFSGVQAVTLSNDQNIVLSGWFKTNLHPNYNPWFVIGDTIEASDLISGGANSDDISNDEEWHFKEMAFKTNSAGTWYVGTESYVHKDVNGYLYLDQLSLLPNLVDNGGCEIDDSGLAITNNETAGADVVIEMVDTGDLAVGDLIYFDGTGGGTTEWTTVKAFTLNTSITVDIATNKSATDEVSGYTWDTEGTPATGEVIFSTNADHSGTLGLELILADDGEGIEQDVTVVSGKWYTFSAWARNNNQDTEILLSDATTKTIDTTNANAWTRYAHTFKAGSTTLTIKLVSGASNQNGYFDDVAVIELDQVDASTASRITEFCAGDLKDVAVFDSVLTPTAILRHYQVGIWGGLAA